MSEKRAREQRKEDREAARLKYQQYRNAGDGCIAWAEENLYVPIYKEGSTVATWTPIKDLPKTINPETGRSYWGMWELQKVVLRNALQMVNGRFIYRLIVFCWPRGEGKSFMANLIQMWKFFCWPKQTIALCANSKDQSTFLQYEEIKTMIENSPRLLRFVGKKNIQEKEIRIKDTRGRVVSTIQSISSFSGIVSNITGYAFSEFFENKRPDFFEKVDGSIRNVPNALGVIDSTVSSKEHTLYKLFESFRKKEDPLLFFHYRFSKEGACGDYWHPYQTQAQLNSYKSKFVLGGFARYFLNLWSAGAEKVFSQEEVEAINYLGANGSVNCHKQVVDLIRRRYEILEGDEKLKAEGVPVYDRVEEIEQVERCLYPVSSVYRLRSDDNVPLMASSDALDKLTDIYDTEWAIIGGIDRADPMKRRTAARTIFNIVAKGLPGSRTNPDIGKIDKPDEQDHGINPEYRMPGLAYIYVLLYLADVADHSLEGLKSNILMAHEEFDGIDVIGSERYAVWDLVPWGEDYNIKFELFHPNYGIQRAAFSYLYTIVNQGRFKGPPTAVAGSRGDDIVREEMANFDHDADIKWFGSPEKNLKNGVQDDFVFALANGIYCGRFLNVDSFRGRRSKAYWGTMMQPGNLIGKW